VVAPILAACGGDAQDTTGGSPAPTMNDTNTIPFAATLRPAMVHLQRSYESLRESHQAITEVWESLATGKQVRCGEYPEALSPESLTAEGETALEPLAALLRRAAIEIDQAASLWKAECLKPRANPSLDVINRGRLAARAAGDALTEAEGLLTGIQ